MQGPTSVLQSVHSEDWVPVGERERRSLLVGDSATHICSGDYLNLVAVDETQPVLSGRHDAIEQILLGDLEDMLNRAELPP